VLQLGRSCKRLHIAMKDDDIWRRLYYQRFVSEEARRSGKVPVLVDGGIYCKHLNKCGCKKHAVDDDDHDDDHNSDHGDDHDSDHGDGIDHSHYHDSDHEDDRGSDYDDYSDCDDYCTGMDEECGFFSTWLSVFRAGVRDAKFRAAFNRKMDLFWDSCLNDLTGERRMERNYVRGPRWWERSGNF